MKAVKSVLFTRKQKKTICLGFFEELRYQIMAVHILLTKMPTFRFFGLNGS